MTYAFHASILRPEQSNDDSFWAFVVLPKEASATLPRRGRTTVVGTMNGEPFQALLEPDGQKSHWLRINDACDMLASGKRRVCCFDSSGYYSKAFSAPKAVGTANE